MKNYKFLVLDDGQAIPIRKIEFISKLTPLGTRIWFKGTRTVDTPEKFEVVCCKINALTKDD